jgi:hypothetical protein
LLPKSAGTARPRTCLAFCRKSRVTDRPSNYSQPG